TSRHFVEFATRRECGSSPSASSWGWCSQPWSRRNSRRSAPVGFCIRPDDRRAHGQSTGGMCTYGFLERRDLGLLLQTVRPGPIVLIGTSLGGAVALQHAASNPAVTAVVGG